MINDYAYPAMMAERALKDLHNAMLENRYDDALEAGLNAITDIRMTILAIKEMKESEKERREKLRLFMLRLLDPEDLGHAVTAEVRQKVSTLLNSEKGDKR